MMDSDGEYKDLHFVNLSSRVADFCWLERNLSMKQRTFRTIEFPLFLEIEGALRRLNKVKAKPKLHCHQVVTLRIRDRDIELQNTRKKLC